MSDYKELFSMFYTEKLLKGDLGEEYDLRSFRVIDSNDGCIKGSFNLFCE